MGMQPWERMETPEELAEMNRQIEAMKLTSEPGKASAEQEPEVLRQLARVIFSDKTANTIALAVAQRDQEVINEYLGKVDRRIVAEEASIAAMEPGDLDAKRYADRLKDLQNLRKMLTEPKLI